MTSNATIWFLGKLNGTITITKFLCIFNYFQKGYMFDGIFFPAQKRTLIFNFPNKFYAFQSSPFILIMLVKIFRKGHINFFGLTRNYGKTLARRVSASEKVNEATTFLQKIPANRYWRQRHQNREEQKSQIRGDIGPGRTHRTDLQPLRGN